MIDAGKLFTDLAEEEFEKNLDKIVLEHIIPDKHVMEREKGHTGTKTVEVVIRKKITKCFYTCPYFNSDDFMTCEHPQGGDHIISHLDCDNGFPAKCPLWIENK